MPQVTKGIRLGLDVKILRGAGDPNSSTDGGVQSAGIGSLFLRTDGSTSTSLYVCTGTQPMTDFGVVALWTAK
jgi:hypothetical protein